MTAVPELRNDGIILNAHNDSEIAAHLAGEDEETARRFGWWPAYSTEETVRTAYANWARNWQEDGPVRAFAARDPGSGALVGNCELRIGPDGTGEVSYWTHAGKRGRGYARNALALLAGYAASIGVTRLEAHVAPDNHASRHVAESAGFTQADTFTDGDGTEFIRYTRDASGDGAAPFTKLGPDPDSSRPNQPCAARHGRTAQPLPPAARRRPGRQRSHPSGAGPADEVTRMTVFSARTLRPPSAPVHGTLFVPATAEPSAAVLLIGGSDGGEPSHMGEALAGEGVAALSVAYFARPGLPGKLRSIPLEYFFAALQTLQNELPSPGTPLAVLGISRGSEAAMLTAIHSPVRVRGVIAAVPGNVVLGGWPPGWAARRPAWLLDGRPLPYVNHFGPRCRDPDALIPVELVPGPVLLVAAGADRVWPSAAMARALSGRLRQHGDSHGHTILEYPQAGHRLGGLLRQPPPGLLPRNTADEAPTRAARADAWPKAIEFIRQLRTPQ